MTVHPESILIVDFGSQVTQLIARRVREAGVYSEIAPFNASRRSVRAAAAQGHHPVRRAGVGDGGRQPARAADHVRQRLPLLGICYGQQVMNQQLGGKVVDLGPAANSAARSSTSSRPAPCSTGCGSVGERHQVWMSHGDRVETLAPGFEVVATSEGAPFAIATNEERKRY